MYNGIFLNNTDNSYAKYIKFHNINNGRIKVIVRNLIAENIDEPFENKVINFNMCHLSRCKAGLRQHLLIRKYIVCMWRNAHLDIHNSYFLIIGCFTNIRIK